MSLDKDVIFGVKYQSVHYRYLIRSFKLEVFFNGDAVAQMQQHQVRRLPCVSILAITSCVKFFVSVFFIHTKSTFFLIHTLKRFRLCFESPRYLTTKRIPGCGPQRLIPIKVECLREYIQQLYSKRLQVMYEVTRWAMRKKEQIIILCRSLFKLLAYIETVRTVPSY